MKNKIFILLLVNIFLFLFIFYKSENQTKGNSLDEIAFSALSQFNSFSIKTSDNRQLEVVNEEDKLWHSTAPISWEISQFLVSELIAHLANIEAIHFSNAEELYAKGEKFSDYGISDKSQKIHLHANDSSLILTKGNPTRDQNFYYFLVQHTKQKKALWKIEKSFAKFFKLSLIEWIDRSILKSPIFSIDKITLNTEEQNDSKIVRLSRNEDRWKMLLPMVSEVDQNELLFLLNKIATIEIEDIVDPGLTPEMPSWDCNFTFNAMTENTSIRFQYFEHENQNILVCSSSSWKPSFLINPKSKSIFEDWSNRIRNKKLWNLSLEKIEKIKIRNSENSLTLRRKDFTSWVGNQSESNSSVQKTYALDSTKIAEFILQLNDIQISELLRFNPNHDELTQEGFGSPSHTLEIEFADSTKSQIQINKTSEEVSFWKLFVMEKSLICLTQTNWDMILRTDIKEFMTREVGETGASYERIEFIIKEDNSSFVTISEDSHGELFQIISEIKAEEILSDSLDPDGIWHEGNWIPWTFKANFFDHSGIKNSIFLCKNTSHWFGGTAYNEITFSLPLPVSDSLSRLLLKE
jgi:hypothetical protein